MVKSALLKMGIVEEAQNVQETEAQFSARHIRAALQFTWVTLTAYIGWRTYEAWDQTHQLACAGVAAQSSILAMLPIAGVSVAIAHLNRRVNS